MNRDILYEVEINNDNSVEVNVDDGSEITSEIDANYNQETVANNNYEMLENKPKINGVELYGNKSFEELGETTATNAELLAMINEQYNIIFG